MAHEISESALPTNPAEKRRRIFLTGAAGRLGTFALRILTAAGHEVVGVDVRSDPSTPEVAELNLLDIAGVRSAMEGCSAVVHLGNHSSQAQRPPAQLFNENAAMSMNVFDTARGMGIRRIISASTIQVIASEWLPGYSTRPPKIPYLPLDSESPADPTNSYAMSKRVSEMVLGQWATEIELEAVSLRFPLLLDTQSPKFPPWYLRALAKEPTPTCIAQAFSWLSYRDAAELIRGLLVAQWKGARVMLPASPTPRSSKSVAELAEQYYAQVPRKAGHDGPLQSLVDISWITCETGWVPRDLLPEANQLAPP